MNGTKKNLRGNRARGGDNASRKKSKADVTLKWDEDIASSGDESQQKSSDEKDEGDEDEEETAEETRKR